MFADIDRIVFPNECPVLEVEPGTRYVYPIFKNGSSSLFAEKKFRLISPAEVENISVIEVFVRDPHERFLSGVQTYLDKSPSVLDRRTLLYVIERYLYLNRHFCPQIYWLLNLSRFTTAKFHLRPLHELHTLVGGKINQGTVDPSITDYFSDNGHVKFFNEMDEVLTKNLIGQTCSLDQIIDVLKTNYGGLYHDTFGTAKALMDVLP